MANNEKDLLENSVGLIEPQIVRFNSPLQLESGDVLEQYQLTYETYGTLNERKTNAILICHALSSDHHAAGHHNNNTDDSGKIARSVGWWDLMIGPNKPIDTNKFFVVSSNNLGGCGGSTGPATVNPKTKSEYGPDFPIVTVSDWVNAQEQLSDYLGISIWSAVIGGSLGGMQVLEWSTKKPHRITNGIVIASAAKLSAQNIGFNDVARQAIRTDPEFHDGNYYQHKTAPTRGLRVARMLGHITYLSDDSMAAKFGRNLRKKLELDFEYDPEFEVESYLRYQGDQFVNKFDANTYLLMTKALDYFDPAKSTEGSLVKAMSNAKANFMVISFTSDWRFSTERSREIVRALQSNNLNVSYAEIDSPHGHDSFLIAIPEYMTVMSAYLNRVWSEVSS